MTSTRTLASFGLVLSLAVPARADLTDVLISGQARILADTNGNGRPDDGDAGFTLRRDGNRFVLQGFGGLQPQGEYVHTFELLENGERFVLQETTAYTGYQTWNNPDELYELTLSRSGGAATFNRLDVTVPNPGNASGTFEQTDGGGFWDAVRGSENNGTPILADIEYYPGRSAPTHVVFAVKLFVSSPLSPDPGSLGTKQVRFFVPLRDGGVDLSDGSGTILSIPMNPDAATPPKTIVPIVLDVTSGTAHFTTELSLANPGDSSTTVTLRYTASLGEKLGSGTVSETIPAGGQVRFPDMISTLRTKGLAIPTTGAQGGVLVVESQGGRVVAAARTTTAVASPEGRAGLAYVGLGSADRLTGSATVYGLRSSAADRSNLAVLSTDDEPVTVRVTAFNGETGASTVVREALTLPSWGWYQFDKVLDGVGFSNGWVTVERTSSGGSFSTYGVVNDNSTNDGSHVPPVAATGAASGTITLPVLVETAEFRSELVVANRGASTAHLSLSYVESLAPVGGAGGTVALDVPAGRQLILADAIQYLRSHGATIGAKGSASYAGAVRVTVSGVSVPEVFIGARTASQAASGGQFGLFTPCVYPGQEATTEARIYGLAADSLNRTNVAVLHAGPDGSGPITLRLQVLDGSSNGSPVGSPFDVTLNPGQWAQPSGFFAAAAAANGIVRVARLSGTASWVAYGVVNDGGQPGKRTGDGAYVPAIVGPGLGATSTEGGLAAWMARTRGLIRLRDEGHPFGARGAGLLTLIASGLVAVVLVGRRSSSGQRF
ncbi:MAG TPA: hypothetical protein PLP50_01810 [Thermoanaerobaculia bacterium]|nr:hypothetical protein [Thermoanaerobaculia bacterium]HQN06978.1 hypothetical protein [Thermoanaerobaculia bacterium]HQP84986.1 hypothetical protein [Thermoanaerobaculia bacterium]